MLCAYSFAQQSNDLEFTLDVTSNTIPLPKIFRPNIDLSGRGFHHDNTWPQQLAAKETLEIWQKDIGFSGIYRIQYNLWEVAELKKDKDLQDKLLGNYESIIKSISDAGGVVILDIFGTPAAMGEILDKKSPPRDLKAFQDLVKGVIRNLSCHKRYNIWYEVWSAPDLDDFFLGRKQEYLNLYKAVAEGIRELEAETKIHIPLGAPAISWWFQNFAGNNIINPEQSLIYELIKFCAGNKLPLDFITWHAYATDPAAEKEMTKYNKTAVALIRDWLFYFHFDRNTNLIIDEWNYDRGANVSPQRAEDSFIAASYIPARMKNMYEAGIDYQIYFSLEDFQNNKENVVRNTGIFSFDSESSDYKGGPKVIYNVFRMLANLGNNLFLPSPKFSDEFVGAIPTKGKDYLALIIYNYINPDMAMNYLSRNISGFNNRERKSLLNIIKSGILNKILSRQQDIARLRLSKKVKTALKKAQELQGEAAQFKTAARNLKLNIKNLKNNYQYQRYVIDSSCTTKCEFAPFETKELPISDLYQETVTMSPYSVQMIILKEKPVEPILNKGSLPESNAR